MISIDNPIILRTVGTAVTEKRLFPFTTLSDTKFMQRKCHRNETSIFMCSNGGMEDRLCGLVVRVSGYRYRGLGFDSRRYQIF